MNIVGVVCAILSVLLGSQDVEQSRAANEFGPLGYHVLNVVMGYGFGVALVTFLHNLGKVLAIAGAFARWFMIATVWLMISGAYLILQYYRIFVWQP